MKKGSFFEKFTGNSSDRSVRKIEETHSSPSASPSLSTKPHKQKEWLVDASDGQISIDVFQTEGEVVIKSTIGGITCQDIDITITNDMLTIKGIRSKDEEIPSECYYYQECYWGPFSRSVILPADVEPDNIKATLKNGVLTIRLPKSEKVKTKKISVNT